MKRLPCKTFQNITQFSGNCFILLVITSTGKLWEYLFKLKIISKFTKNINYGKLKKIMC